MAYLSLRDGARVPLMLTASFAAMAVATPALAQDDQTTTTPQAATTQAARRRMRVSRSRPASA